MKTVASLVTATHSHWRFPLFGNDRVNFRQFPDLVPFHGRSLSGRRVLQCTAGRFPPDAPRSYALSRGAPILDGLLDVLLDHLGGARFVPGGFSEPGAGLATEAEKNYGNFDSAWPPTR
jgi:hypothetical protein